MFTGGDPAAIPDLTYKGFKTFHEEHYHPSNSLLYFYGDDDEGKRLEIAGDYLSGFAEKALDFKPRHQVREVCLSVYTCGVCKGVPVVCSFS